MATVQPERLRNAILQNTLLQIPSNGGSGGTGPPGPPGPPGPAFGNMDGGSPFTIYGGISPVDGGTP